MKFFKKGTDQIISQVVILSMVFGFAAGVVGQIVADVYIDPFDQDFIGGNLNTNTSTIPELYRVKRFLGIEQDFEVDTSIEKVSPGVVGIYPQKSATASSLDQIYLPSELIANGFVLTSDGWVVTHFSRSSLSSMVVVYDGKVFEITEEINDATTGVSFIKISAINLPVVVLGDSSEATLGQLEIVLNDLDQVVVSNIKSLNHRSVDLASSFVLSSEEYGELILLDDSLTDNYLGSPLVNLGGEVVGIVSGVDELGMATVVPINQFRSIILDVLRNSIVKRSFLGVDYIDLSSAVGLDEELTQGLDRGALVWKDPSRNTPASSAELKEDDIILSIDGQLINSEHGLTELVQQYQPGDEIVLEVLRNGNTLTGSAVLTILPE